MKYLSIFLTAILILFATPIDVHAQTPYYGEHIADFQQITIINTDGTIDVTETISYVFGNQERHGIFRTIPYTKLNKVGKKYKMTFSGISVTDEIGKKYPFSQTDESGEISLKIGDPDVTISGQHTYEIRYSVSGALTYFSDHDELYWNVTGNEWDVPIAQAQSLIQIPRSIIVSETTGLCYQGEKGSTDQCVAGKVGNTLVFEASALQSNTGMSIVVGFPKGHVAELEPVLITDFFETFIGRLTILGMMIVGFLWYIVYPLWLPIKWWREGRDSNHVSTGVVRAWFDPPKKDGRYLTPAEAGTLIDERAELQEVVALLVHMAQRGYLTIHEIKKKDFKFIKTDKDIVKGDLLDFEEKMLTGLFKDKTHVRLKEKQLSSLVSTVQDMIYTQTVKDGFFPEHPEKVRQKYALISGLSIITFNFFLALSAAVFGRIMPRKTLDGVHAANSARSLKNFLQSQERQLEFQVEKQLMFEKLLPYAVSFGVEKIWAERFKDLKLKDVDWYQSSTSHVLTAHALSSGLNGSFAPSFQSAVTPVSSSTGHSSGFSGGSSGGGGGGGGGGSW